MVRLRLRIHAKCASERNLRWKSIVFQLCTSIFFRPVHKWSVTMVWLIIQLLTIFLYGSFSTQLGHTRYTFKCPSFSAILRLRSLKSVSLSTPRGPRCSLHSTCALPVGTGRIERRNKTRFKLCQQSPWMIDATKFQVQSSPLQTIPSGKQTELLKIAIYGWFTMIYLIKIG